MNGVLPRDVIEWRMATDDADVRLQVRRGDLQVMVDVVKRAGVPLGAEVESAVFDRVRTCDNHCSFCFIHQLPKGMRRSLYLKDDDYRLSFLYGNFTTLTRFTESDLERVVTERLSPINVSIHATDPEIRAAMLKNRRGATSLRWLRALLDHGIRVRGQLVVCPGVNDAAVLERTMAGLLDEYPELQSVAVVPLGLSRFNPDPAMRPHTAVEAAAVLDAVERWQGVFRSVVGHRMVFAADEYYLMTGRAFPAAEDYEGFDLHEDGIGMARTFEREFHGTAERPTGTQAGFFAWVDGAPAEGYRAPRNPAADTGLRCGDQVPEQRVTLGRPRRGDVAGAPATSRPAPIGVLTGAFGARVLQPLVDELGRADVRVIAVRNDFFGGTTAVTGLLTGQDVARVLRDAPTGHRYLLPDVCLNQGRFLDGVTLADLPRPVEVIETDGFALRAALGADVGATVGAR